VDTADWATPPPHKVFRPVLIEQTRRILEWARQPISPKLQVIGRGLGDDRQEQILRDKN